MATFNTVATQVKSVLDGLSSAPTTVIRKDGTIHARETLPLIVISLWSDETDAWGTIGAGSSTDQGDVGNRFTLAITLYRAVLGDTESNLSTTADYWQAAKKALSKGSLSGVDSAWNVQVQSSELFDGQAWKEGHELSQIFIIVGCSELRNS